MYIKREITAHLNIEPLFQHSVEGKVKLRLQGGRTEFEGRVEVQLAGSEEWGLLCGDGWSLLEGMVVCRQLGYGYAQGALSTGFFGGNKSDIIISGMKCTGNEKLIEQCLHDAVGEVFCPDPSNNGNIAGVTCVQSKFIILFDSL
ncbi:Lysyl oxidase 3 [Portunus trituberculatus]|uniref:Lysyl oxidase 3 n=1 Tax=Portunus trituberculatus TaxID=210409 RepID=A0A5B7J2T3_PORTR|nr:Lysyl oxidase 3 [Portunus trituberculatus]